MATTNLPIQHQNSRQYFFRGYAVAAGGFLTRIGSRMMTLDPTKVTTHGESSLPLVGGVSHSIVRTPQLSFPGNIHYGSCETFVEGRYQDPQTTVTTLRASVNDVRLTTGPSPDDNVPNVQSISFRANSIILEAESVATQAGQSSYTVRPTQPSGMALVITDKSGKDTTLPITLEFDPKILSLQGIEEVEKEYAAPDNAVIQGSGISRTPRGFILTSFVRSIRVGDEHIPGNVLTRKGFGSIQFGLAMINPAGRRFVMAHIQMGSDPGGDADFCAVEDTGDWGY